MTTATQQAAKKRAATAAALPITMRMATSFNTARPPLDPVLRADFEAGFLTAVHELTGAYTPSLDLRSGSAGEAYDLGYKAAHEIHAALTEPANV